MAPRPCAAMCAAWARTDSQTALRLTAIVLSQSFSDYSSMGAKAPIIPALLKAKSRPPMDSTVLATIRS